MGKFVEQMTLTEVPQVGYLSSRVKQIETVALEAT